MKWVMVLMACVTLQFMAPSVQASWFGDFKRCYSIMTAHGNWTVWDAARFCFLAV